MKRHASRRHQARLLVGKLAQPDPLKREAATSPGSQHRAAEFFLDREQSHHVMRVLRLQPNDALELLDGAGHCYLTRIVSLSKDRVTLREQAQCFVPPNRLQLSLIQGLSSADHMDFSIQKGVELGLNAFVPVHCERSVSRIDASRAASKQGHWNRVAQAACMQSGHPWLPRILEPMTLQEGLGWAASHRDAENAPKQLGAMPLQLWMLDPYASEALRDRLLASAADAQQSTPSVILLVGPEAGLSDQEAEAAKAAGFLALHAGPRTLRTETAALAAIAAIQATWGDWADAPSARWLCA
ncbi:MAG: 16S rRNA (uracil(1498)-N(3))-methyltransferase [Betaproteobacteria bacterium]|nr:16S rRNA (uracil(1498)-N(3))-methyltransferase [Betaproteobacteria bacterium]NDD77904.1 16S rRNA (uracil(1498)-N(3))-methyltransferase [Betaproteobacteria bacterium]